MAIQRKSLIGKPLVCAETGKAFVGEPQGATVNYATDAQGHVLSDEGVDLRERRQLLDRSSPFCGYISSDGRFFTGWKGNELGRVTKTMKTDIRSNWAGQLKAYNVRDCHGAMWYGRGAEGMCIILRPMKGGSR